MGAHPGTPMLTVRFVLPLPQGSSQAVRQGVSQKCNHQAHRRFYLYPCLSTEMIDALERRRVNHCYHAGHRPRRHVVRPPPITPITQNQADLPTQAQRKKRRRNLCHTNSLAAAPMRRLRILVDHVPGVLFLAGRRDIPRRGPARRPSLSTP